MPNIHFIFVSVKTGKGYVDLNFGEFLKNRKYGVFIEDISNPPDSVRITNSLIEGKGISGNLYGLYLCHPQARIQGCSINGYLSAGIISRGPYNPLILENEICNHVGIECDKESCPTILTCNIHHEYLKLGIYAPKNCYPFAGNEEIPGKNSISFGASTGYYIINENEYPVWAQFNYWGVVPPYPWGFIGRVIYEPFLEENPFGKKYFVIDRNLPEAFSVPDNYPNPFNAYTNICLNIPKNGFVEITIYNVLGQITKNLCSKSFPGGYHTVLWDATNNAGKSVGSGIYFTKVLYNGTEKTQKMLLLR